jgi:hypothetical protein
MKRFVEGEDRRQGALLPHCLDDYVTENNPVRVIEAFIDELDLATLGFEGVVPETTGHPAYHPATLLKIYLYGAPAAGADQIPPRDVSARHRLLARPHFPPPCLVLPPYCSSDEYDRLLYSGQGRDASI